MLFGVDVEGHWFACWYVCLHLCRFVHFLICSASIVIMGCLRIMFMVALVCFFFFPTCLEGSWMTHERKPLRICFTRFLLCPVFNPFSSTVANIFVSGPRSMLWRWESGSRFSCILFQRSYMVKWDLDWLVKFYCEAWRRPSWYNDSTLVLLVFCSCIEGIFRESSRCLK